MLERADRETKQYRKKLLEWPDGHDPSGHGPVPPPAPDKHQAHSQHRSTRSDSLGAFIKGSLSGIHEALADKAKHVQNLQNRASAHLEAIIDQLVNESTSIENREAWKVTIRHLVREVVSSVDPNVRQGDSMDIRNYVKLKIIPGGSMDENTFINGVVFRKNVSHKKMGTNNGSKQNPRILLLAGGIEFQRTDSRLSSMETLIEQEDKYMQILVDKIMSLKPDIILVGKSVARRAQELLFGYNVVVMQNVKYELLERIGRMTGATTLSSTDHMFQQFGEECLGTCEEFWLRIVHDDPEKSEEQRPRRVLQTRIARGSTYAYLQGCPSEKGCTIVLRGARRSILDEVRHIISFSIVVAYHLRLEVAYYTDRAASLPPSCDDTVYDYDSDNELGFAGKYSSMMAEGLGSSTPQQNQLLDRSNRYLLSMSLDVDVSLPYHGELRGLHNQGNTKPVLTKTSPQDHQTLLVTSLLMGGESVQRSKAEVKGIRYYTSQDVALGQFLIENCFHMHRNATRDVSMLDQTLSFIHRPGRLDITVSRIGDAAAGAQSAGADDSLSSLRHPLNLPITMSSFCRECAAVVTPEVIMSDETWKMSFGKFMETFFYNRSARCRTGPCNHCIRDNHILTFCCENYCAKFSFIPMHPYALHIRTTMDFPNSFHIERTKQLLSNIPVHFSILVEEFRKSLVLIEREAREVLASKPDELTMTLLDLLSIEQELKSATISIVDHITDTLLKVPPSPDDLDEESPGSQPASAAVSEYAVASHHIGTLHAFSEFNNVDLKVKFPMYHKREAFLVAASWNTRIASINRHLESVRDFALQQQQQQQQLLQSQTMATVGFGPDSDDDLPDAAPVAEVVGVTSASAPKGKTSSPTADHDDDGGSADHLHKVGDNVVAANAVHDEAATTPTSPRSGDESAHDLVAVKNAVAISQSAGDGSVTVAEPIVDVDSKSLSIRLPSELLPGVDASRKAFLDGKAAAAALHEQEKKAGNQNKTNRLFAKALTRLGLGKDSSAEESSKRFEVPLGDIEEGRLGLPPGRNGEIIPVHEDELGTIIAYSLASQEYYDDLQVSRFAVRVLDVHVALLCVASPPAAAAAAAALFSLFRVLLIRQIELSSGRLRRWRL
jgi:TCP-1/cpn60 chaperonin family